MANKYEELKTFFYPKSIAIYGASNSPMKFANMHLMNMLHGRYEGKIFIIHPKEPEILGFKAYKSVLDVSEPIDLALIVAPTKVVPQLVEDCGKKGIRHVICVTAGFAEIGNQDGREVLYQTAKKYGIHIFGPNCIGVISPGINLNCSPVPHAPPKGHVGLISHSGSWASHILFLLKEKLRLGISKIASLGNEVNTDMVDVLEAYELDPDVSAIGLYIEGLRRPKEFFEAAKRVTPKKPIIACPIGQGEAGMRAANSHTGAISTPAAIMNPVLKQSGILVAESNDEMLSFLQAVTSQPLPKGPRVGIVTVGGGPGTSIADLCEKYGLQVPLLSESLRERIDAILPFTASSKNPVDVTFDRSWENFYQKVPKLLAQSGEVDAFIFYGIFSMESWWGEFMSDENPAMDRFKIMFNKEMLGGFHTLITSMFRTLIRTGKKHEIPILFTNLFLSRTDTINEYLQTKGIPVFLPSTAPKILSFMWQYAQYRKKMNRIG
jgi:acyl-CoA synthetase (NDP forming)